MTLSYAEVAEILKVVDASTMDELVLEIGDARLVVRRGAPGGGVATPAAVSAGQADQAPAATVAAPGLARAAAPAPAPVEGAEPVESPMVGRFYRCPAPDEPPFVEVGQQVAAGATLCLIEVMKLFTAVEAPTAGTVVDVAVEDGAAVEYDTVLFWIRPD